MRRIRIAAGRCGWHQRPARAGCGPPPGGAAATAAVTPAATPKGSGTGNYHPDAGCHRADQGKDDPAEADSIFGAWVMPFSLRSAAIISRRMAFLILVPDIGHSATNRT